MSLSLKDARAKLADAVTGVAVAQKRVAHFAKRYKVAKAGGHAALAQRAGKRLHFWNRRLEIALKVQDAARRVYHKALRHRTYGAGGFAPTSRWHRQRVDQGQDFEIPLGEHLRAPGDGVVLEWASDGPFPNGFGSPYAVVQFSTGPFAHVGPMYIGHVNVDVPPVGTHFKEGDRLGKPTNSLNAGWGWTEAGLWPPGPDGNGASIAHLFHEVRA